MSTSNVATIGKQKPNFPAFAMDEDELLGVLENSLYPGAQKNSIKMVISYCRASNLDPMQKPVHIVPIWDSKASAMRDVVMPGIGLYRSQASRSGHYAGVTEPEFGDDVTELIGGTEITYPKWCKVTVKRYLPELKAVVEYSAKELWKENYATKGGKDKSIAPNAMWYRRPYAQLAKCAEAQALRKAFPEFGAQPTADEMEGKELDITDQVSRVDTQAEQPEVTYLDEATFKTLADSYKSKVLEGKKTPGGFISWVEAKGSLMTDKQKAEVNTWT